MVYIGTESNMNSRTVPVISLNASNDMNGQYFMSLNTGKRIYSKQWDQIPIDEFVIYKVKELVTNKEQPLIQNKCSLFEWGVGIEIEVINIEDNYDIIEQNQEEHNESIDIRDDSINQAIVTEIGRAHV